MDELAGGRGRASFSMRPSWRPCSSGAPGRRASASTATVGAGDAGARGRPHWRGCAAWPAPPSSRRAPPPPGRRGPCWPPWRCPMPVPQTQTPSSAARRPRPARPRRRSRGSRRELTPSCGTEVGDLVALAAANSALQDLLQVEPGVIRADGDAHGESSLPARRGAPGASNRYAPRSMALDPRTPVVVGVGPGRHAARRRARPGRAARAGRADGHGAAGGGRGLRRGGARRGSPGRGRAHPAGGQHPGRGPARVALGQPGPARGGAPRLRRGRRAGAS